MSLLGNFFKRNKAGSNHYLALDIGTQFVKALVFEVDQELQKGIVLGVGRAYQKIGNMTSGAVSNIEGVIATCEDAISEAEEMAGVHYVKKTVMGIAGELVKGTTTTVHYERARPEIRIDVPELKNIIQKVQWKALGRIRQQLAWETGHKAVDVRLINAAIVNVKIDGYRVSTPVSFQGRDVSISIFNAYAPLIHLGAMEKIADELGLELVEIVAEPFAVAKSMGIDQNSQFGAIFIDIGGGTTDIALVRNGVLEGTVMFGLGGTAFTKRISSAFGLSFEEAEQVKINYSLGTLNPRISQKIEQFFEKDCQIWASGLEIALESFSASDLFPSRILLCGGGSALPGISRVLKERHWPSHLPIPEQINISFIQPRDVVRIADKTRQLRNPQDVTPMALASVIVDRSEQDPIISDTLKKAVKILQS